MRFAMCSAALLALSLNALASTNEELKQQVMQTEKAFAKTMADRDLSAFSTFVSDEAKFFGGGGRVLHGRSEVVAAWTGFYQGAQAPFSWEPDQVEVLDSGALALSTGPVRDPSGKVVSRFSSIWRQDAPGVWHIVFDRGEPVRENK